MDIISDSVVLTLGWAILSGAIVAFLIWLRPGGRKVLQEVNDAASNNKQRNKNTNNHVAEAKTAIDAKSTNKRIKEKKRREAQQEFSHPWMVGTLKGHTGNILDIDFSPNGKYLASSANDRTVVIWCTKDLLSKDRKSLRINVEYDNAKLIKWSPDGKAFIIHKELANVIEVYKVSKKSDGTPGSATKAVEFPKHHESDVIAMDIACNGKFIITCTADNMLVLWDLKGQILSTINTNQGSTHKAHISPCGRFVASSGFTPDLKVWEVTFTKTDEFKQVVSAFDLGGHASGIYDFAFNADTSKTVTISKDGTFRFYDTKVEFKKGEDPRLILKGQWTVRTSATVALSPNADIVAIAHGSSLSLYSTISGTLDTTIEDIFNDPIIKVTFDSAGEYILVAGDRHVKIFRNVPGYRASIESCTIKLAQKQTSATKERLEKTILDCKEFLNDMKEPLSLP